MSDFIYCAQRRAPGELRACLQRCLAPVEPAIAEHHGAWGSLAVARFPHDHESVVVDDGHFLSVLAGEPIVRIGPEPAGLCWRGGRRQALHELLKTDGDAEWDQLLDGHFAVLGIDTGTGSGMVLTDLFAFIPVFTSTDAEDALVIGTHVDVVAHAAGRIRDIDPVSAADLVATLVCTYPYTLFRDVEQFPPASVRALRAGRWQSDARAYWCPLEGNPYASVSEAARALRDALMEDVHATCDGVDEVGLLLSGGEDARAVLGAVPATVRVRAFTYADWENREVRVARALARAYGARHVFGRRLPDHYIDGMEAVASTIGSHNNFMDVHGWGFHDRLGIRELPVVLGGLSADSLLKAEHSSTQAASTSTNQVPGVRVELLRAVAERHETYRARLATFRPGSADEWTRLWPITMRKHSANLHGNRRLFASHEPFHASAVVKLAATVPLEWKQHRKLFHAAMRPLFRRSWHIPHARWRFPYFREYANLPLTVGLRVTRGLRALATGELRARQGPWPKWSHVAGSAAAQAKWRAYPLADSPIADIFLLARPAELDAAVRDWYALRQLMLLQLVYLTSKAAEE